MLFVFLGASLAATPADAQLLDDFFGTIFGQPPQPPRPPQQVPGRQQQSYPPQQQYQQQRQYQQRPDAPPPSLQQPGPPRPAPQQGNIQSQPLPPPPGGSASPGGVQRQPRGAPQQPPVEASAPPSDEVEPSANKVPNPTSVFAGLDKITGRITSFEVALNETVQFGALQVTPRACYTRPPTETPHTDAFIEVDEVTLQGEIRRIYTGWMFAASPGLHAVEHPIYDIWLTDCKGGAVAEAAPEPEPAPRPAARAQQPSQPRQPPQQPRRVAPQAPPPQQQPY
jgi:hypothetical protein